MTGLRVRGGVSLVDIVELTPELARRFEFEGAGEQFGGIVPVSEMLPKLIEAGPAFAAVETYDPYSHPYWYGGSWGIVAVGGAAMLWPGVYEAWLMLNPKGERYAKTLVRAARRLFKFLLEHEAHRIQTTVRCDSEKQKRWVRVLGFRCEAFHRQLGPDRADHFRYVILKEEG